MFTSINVFIHANNFMCYQSKKSDARSCFLEWFDFGLGFDSLFNDTIYSKKYGTFFDDNGGYR